MQPRMPCGADFAAVIAPFSISLLGHCAAPYGMQCDMPYGAQCECF